MRWTISRSKFILVVVIVLVAAISYGVVTVVRNQSSSADLRTRSLRNRPTKPFTISGVGVRLVATSDPTVISTGVTDQQIKFAALHLATGAALEDTKNQWEAPEFKQSRVEAFFQQWSSRPDVDLMLDINGLGSKSTNSKGPILTGPVPDKILDRLGPGGTISYATKLIDTGQPITRRLPNPCNRRWLGWYSRYIQDAGEKLDGHPGLGAVLFATGMTNGLNLGNEELFNKFQQVGCTRERFTQATKVILREVKRSFPNTPVVMPISQMSGFVDGYALDPPYLAELLTYAYQLGFSGAEAHTLSGNVKKLNNKTVYAVLANFVRQYPDFYVIDGPDDPLVNSLNLESESEAQFSDPTYGFRAERKLGDFKLVTQAALNQLPGVNFTLTRTAVKFYAPDVKLHEQTEDPEIEESFKTLNAALYTQAP